MNSKYSYLLNNTLIFAIGSFGSKLISFLLVPFYTYVLTTSEYGQADYVMTISYLLIPIISFAFQDSVLRFGLENKSDCSNVAANSLFVFLLGAILLILLHPLILKIPSIRNWLPYLYITILSTNACNILFSYAKVKGKNKLFSVVSILQTFLIGILNIYLLIFVKCGVAGYLLSNILANMFVAVVLFYATGFSRDIHKFSIDIILLKEMLRYSLPLIVNNLSWWILNSSDRVIINNMLSTSDLGLYTAASKIPGFISILSSIFSNAWTLSSIVEYDSDADPIFYSNVFHFFYVTVAFFSLLLISITRPLMSVYVSSDFFDSWTLVPMLVAATAFFSYSSFFGAIYGAVKKNVATAFTTFVAAFLNISLNLLLIDRYGLIVVSFSTLVGYFSIFVLRLINSRKYFSFYIDGVGLFLNCFILVAFSILITFGIDSIYVYLSTYVFFVLINFCFVKHIVSKCMLKWKADGLSEGN